VIECQIAVIPGDGIGTEVIAEGLKVLRAAEAAVGGFHLEFEMLEAGAGCYQRTGVALPAETVSRARAADAILLGACGLPDVRYPDGTEIAPQVDLRTILDLYAGIRPARLYPGVPCPLTGRAPGEIDFVVVRESTEGLFASRSTGIVLGDQIATDTQVITRAGSERVARAAFDWCRRRAAVRPDRKRRVTCVDKANIFRSFAFFRRVFDEVATAYPEIAADHVYVDAAAMYLVRQPETFDVLVTENMFGDILSDLAAALVGGLGVAPSADIGDDHAVFQPCHGTAPDIAGQGIANPIATILSAAMMLEWLASRVDLSPATRAFGAGTRPSPKRGGGHDTGSQQAPPPRFGEGAEARGSTMSALHEAALRIEAAVAAALAAGEAQTPDLGGRHTTAEAGDAVCRRLTA
jgi:3-isopropylmalate dehydrogenase